MTFGPLDGLHLQKLSIEECMENKQSYNIYSNNDDDDDQNLRTGLYEISLYEIFRGTFHILFAL